MILDDYRTWIFDCDGVLLDSNQVKSEAFRQLGSSYGMDVADALVAYHVEHGGISRFEKVTFLFTELLEHVPTESEFRAEVERYGDLVRHALSEVAEVRGARTLLEELVGRGSTCFVVSGGLTSEIRDELARRDLLRFFREVHGSPPPKRETLATVAQVDNTDFAVYLGDSRYDYEIAHQVGIDFLFVAGASEFRGWRDFVGERGIAHVETLEDVLNFAS